MKQLFFIFLIANVQILLALEPFFIKAADISSLPELEQKGVVFYNATGKVEDMLTTLKNAGCNTIRVRLWKNPNKVYCNFNNVKTFTKRIKKQGLKVWLDIHYSNTWADPSHQKIPKAWQNLAFTQLEDSLYQYTARIIREIKPDYVQIGNEINHGFLWEAGHIDNKNNFLLLLQTAIKAVRSNNKESKIILHYAGIQGSNWFYQNMSALDYDIIGITYYPIWHQKDLSLLQNKLTLLAKKYNKKIVIAETSYPFTPNWQDNTHNIVGLSSQLIKGFSATPKGQLSYMMEIKKVISTVPNGIGFCYWGAELISDKKFSSPYENQALYDFEHKVLPVMRVFRN